jgi:hypothetical protein
LQGNFEYTKPSNGNGGEDRARCAPEAFSSLRRLINARESVSRQRNGVGEIKYFPVAEASN